MQERPECQLKEARGSWACVLGRDPGENRGRRSWRIRSRRKRMACNRLRDPGLWLLLLEGQSVLGWLAGGYGVGVVHRTAR